jgi:hypothetical protein
VLQGLLVCLSTIRIVSGVFTGGGGGGAGRLCDRLLWPDHKFFGELILLFSDLWPTLVNDVITFRRRKTNKAYSA